MSKPKSLITMKKQIEALDKEYRLGVKQLHSLPMSSKIGIVRLLLDDIVEKLPKKVYVHRTR